MKSRKRIRALQLQNTLQDELPCKLAENSRPQPTSLVICEGNRFTQQCEKKSFYRWFMTRWRLVTKIPCRTWKFEMGKNFYEFPGWEVSSCFWRCNCSEYEPFLRLEDEPVFHANTSQALPLQTCLCFKTRWFFKKPNSFFKTLNTNGRSACQKGIVRTNRDSSCRKSLGHWILGFMSYSMHFPGFRFCLFCVVLSIML